MASRYAVGIDLGTTNSVLAYVRLDAAEPAVELLPISQLVASKTVESRPSLPSFMYLGTDHETRDQALDLPWAADRRLAVGELARARSAEAPERTVAAAKSWLCHSRVDRRADILPWNGPAEIDKISPVAATRCYLEHLRDAWDNGFPETPLADQQIVLTVPASFDAAARELTREAALEASLPADLVLLEEPQAASYAWLASRGDRWRSDLHEGDTVLICDVGGGTSDLTLITVAQQEGELVLRRVAVGNHLLVGGDNMDLALAHYVAGLLKEKGHNLDPWQSVGLWHACRAAKETLLASDGPETYTVSVLGRGSRVIGGTISVEVDRRRAAELLLEGFFPQCDQNARPEARRASGFQEIGLPFESDAAITRHLAAFLSEHSNPQTDDPTEAHDRVQQPTHVLFNGGVFKAPALRQRTLETLTGWCNNGEPLQELAAEQDLDHSVARGAAYYGWAKEQGGVRIRGGIARVYYIGVETAGLAIPGAPRPLNALCVAPMGMEEGSQVDVPSGEIGLVLGESAHFRFFSSAVRHADQPGDVLTSWDDDELVETDSLETTLAADNDGDNPELDGSYVPVRFQARVTELGVFELWCVSTKTPRRWKLEFSVREQESAT